MAKERIKAIICWSVCTIMHNMHDETWTVNHFSLSFSEKIVQYSAHDTYSIPCILIRTGKPFDRLRSAIRESLGRSGVGARKLESKLGLRPWSLRGILDSRRPQVPSVDRAFEICKALGLEFYIGPRRTPASPQPSVQREDPPDWVALIRSEIRQILRPENASLLDDLVGVPHLRTVIGSGTDHLDPGEILRVPFNKSWLVRNGVDPAHCYMVRVQGEAMAPTLPDGCLVLVSPGWKDRENDRIYLVRSHKGLIARRVKKGPNGSRAMVADNPALDDHLWPPDEDVLGELVWMARCLRGFAAEAEVMPGEYRWQAPQPAEDRPGYLHRSDPEMPGDDQVRRMGGKPS